MTSNAVVPGSTVLTAELGFDPDAEAEVDESPRNDVAVDPPVDESPTSTDDVPNEEPSKDVADVDELPVSDAEEPTPLADELEVVTVAPFEVPVPEAPFVADPDVPPVVPDAVAPVVPEPFVADAVAPVVPAPFVPDAVAMVEPPVVDVPVVPAVPVVVPDVDAPAVVDPDVVLVAEPLGVPDVVVPVEVDPGVVDSVAAGDVVVEVAVDPVVDDPGQTIVSPLHIWPLEQLLSVY
ncbi:hypothetical protein DVH05_020043 [Phytophthora capsici]|nr:hypothetical protein DVH05_020043 [Phytophthora capsici]